MKTAKIHLQLKSHLLLKAALVKQVKKYIKSNN